MNLFKGPEKVWKVTLDDDSEDVLDRLESVLERVEAFRLVSKLSDGGVVTRTLAAPVSENPIFGHRNGNHLNFALTNIGTVSSPFQPICRCTLSLGELHLTARPHRQSMVLFPFYVLSSVLLICVAIFTCYHEVFSAMFCSATMAICLISIPYYRMHQGFYSDLQRLSDFLEVKGVFLDNREN